MTKTDTTPARLNGKGAPAPGRATVVDSYLECTKFVLKKVAPLYRIHALAIDAQTVAAVVATIFIERSKRGQ